MMDGLVTVELSVGSCSVAELDLRKEVHFAVGFEELI